MAEDTKTPPSSPNTQNPHRPRRDAPRHHGARRQQGYREPAAQPAEKQTEKPQESKELSLDDEETEQDRSAAPSRHSRGGRGKPPKRIIEEWASDIYCE